ncbi:TRAP transporter substrate-binding protein [Mesorhizobium microcysteis]|jgi:TRAP-type mannitol/chloroaromatic compound transport system substrate-binding protein|uniref:TRAP transporter substrate-binding protein n=1 Tax=Neoaquamicrobium microcysteis TaxID=2682781 RepID=A0A5D4GU87_9HYPH|nr:TRAP transporter substrate-binding protein [Mesorhizobium microcysteis]TYR31359.1 TRAP transporter substrate-binding protein [Mesorhizobium microcysteis]
MTKAAISRRRFLHNSTLGGAAVAATTLAAPAVLAQAPVRLRMQTSWPSSDIFQEMAQQYVDRVHAMSGGRLQIDLLPAGAVVGAFQVQDAVHDGVIDICHTVTAYWYGKNKASSLFGTGPIFGGDAAAMLAWIHNGGGQELYRELVEDILGLNIIGRFAMPMPTQPLGWFKEPIENVSQLAGLRYRTVGLAADLLQAMGLSVAQLPGGEIVPAMERGVIDAFEFNNPTSDMRFGAQDVAKNYMMGSFHQANEFFEFNFNRDMWDGLDEDLRAILDHSTEAANTANYALALSQYSQDLLRLRDENGVNIIRTPQDFLQAQLEAWDQIMPDLMADEFFAKVVESQKQWCDRVGYYSFFNQTDYKMAYEHHFPGKLGF